MTNVRTTTPPLEDFDVTADGGTYSFTGRHLAHATSQWDTHGHDGDFAARGERCSACRWTEIDIYVSHHISGVPNVGSPLGRYLVTSSGCSVVPSERTFTRATWTDSPYEVLEILTQRRGPHVTLPGPAARALARAAEFDDGLNDAYVNRAVA